MFSEYKIARYDYYKILLWIDNIAGPSALPPFSDTEGVFKIHLQKKNQMNRYGLWLVSETKRFSVDVI